MNSVIVVSRNLDSIYEEGGTRHYFSFQSSYKEKINLPEKNEHFFSSVFKSVISNLIFLSSIVFRHVWSVHVREIVIVT